MKKRLVIDGTGGTKWIGGLYYKRNIIFSLLQNNSIVKNFEIIVITEPINSNIFSCFKNQIIIKYISFNNEKERKIKLFIMSILLHANYFFPSFGKLFKYFNVNDIHWIADFQHNWMPNFFTDNEVAARTIAYTDISNLKTPLVLSSYDSLKDFKKYYSKDRTNVYVVPFVSYIEPIIRNINSEREVNILSKFNLLGTKYACIMNQFWKHKNHIVVFKAMYKYYLKNPTSNFLFVFTGKMEDYRNPQYIESLKEILQLPEISSHIRMVGFVEREEQIFVMKNAEYVIQPSLFEGWGTVVEDAKVLDKTILLSDISIHHEQKSDKCIFFDPNNSEQLEKLIEKENTYIHNDSVEAGIADMYIRAKIYSMEFEKLLGC